MPGTPLQATQFGGSLVLIHASKAYVTAMKYVNEDAGVRFCQIFDAVRTADVTLGTTEPTWVMTAGANGGDDAYTGNGLVFDRGIVVAGTTTARGNGGAGSQTQHLFICVE